MLWDFTAKDLWDKVEAFTHVDYASAAKFTSRGLRIQNQNKNAKYAIALTWQASTNLGKNRLTISSREIVSLDLPQTQINHKVYYFPNFCIKRSNLYDLLAIPKILSCIWIVANSFHHVHQWESNMFHSSRLLVYLKSKVVCINFD